jgi:sugar (pentulose or hexulose) kinase
MLPECVIVLDVGMTLSKLSLFGRDGRPTAQRAYQNRVIEAHGRHWLDTDGIDLWVRTTLQEFGSFPSPTAIVPVGHGAAAALVRERTVVCPVPDYEDDIGPALRAEYDPLRDPFAATGSPTLPGGLNLGAQLYRLQREIPGLWNNGTVILPWPQFWAWKLTNVAASEVSSLGCHTDLWLPQQRCRSTLARKLGWVDRLAAICAADSVLGPVSREYARATGLPADISVYCGAHDSNAALHAVRGYPEVAGREATVISTGTWFVAMRILGATATSDFAALPESRDCLVNVDVAGRPVPSARFMGGRELDMLGGVKGSVPGEALAALRAVLHSGAMVLPGIVPGVGPFPHAAGGWIAEPSDAPVRSAAAALYAALMLDTALELIGARELLIVEGRFALCELFVRALATLRVHDRVLMNRECSGGVSFAALRLVDAELPPTVRLDRAVPFDIDLSAYKARWLEAASRQKRLQ